MSFWSLQNDKQSHLFLLWLPSTDTFASTSTGQAQNRCWYCCWTFNFHHQSCYPDKHMYLTYILPTHREPDNVVFSIPVAWCIQWLYSWFVMPLPYSHCGFPVNLSFIAKPGQVNFLSWRLYSVFWFSLPYFLYSKYYLVHIKPCSSSAWRHDFHWRVFFLYWTMSS